jgi:hypothetical protein
MARVSGLMSQIRYCATHNTPLNQAPDPVFVRFINIVRTTLFSFPTAVSPRTEAVRLRGYQAVLY